MPGRIGRAASNRARASGRPLARRCGSGARGARAPRGCVLDRSGADSALPAAPVAHQVAAPSGSILTASASSRVRALALAHSGHGPVLARTRPAKGDAELVEVVHLFHPSPRSTSASACRCRCCSSCRLRSASLCSRLRLRLVSLFFSLRISAGVSFSASRARRLCSASSAASCSLPLAMAVAKRLFSLARSGPSRSVAA